MSERDLELEHRVTKVEEAVALLPVMAAQLNEMSLKFAKYEGRWGSITMIGMGCWAVFVVFKDTLWHWIFGVKNGNL